MSPKQQMLYPEPTEKEAIAALDALSTPIKSKKKRQRQTPMYFKTRKSTRIGQGKSQTPTRTPIFIEESPSKGEELEHIERKVEETTPPRAILKTPITYVRKPVARETSSKQPKTPVTLQ